MQIKVALRFPLTPVSVAVNQKTDETNTGEDVGKEESLFIAGGTVNPAKPLWKSIRKFKKKKKWKRKALPCDPAVPLLESTPQRYPQTHFRALLLTIARK